MTAPLWKLGAMELARRIRSGEVASTAVVAAHLDRISAVNPLVNAITVTLGEQALRLAEAADRALESGKSQGLAAIALIIQE